MVATSLIRCGQKFGQLATIRGVTKYQISPFEQKVFGGFFVKSTVNVLWLLRRNIFYFGPRMLKEFIFFSCDKTSNWHYNWFSFSTCYQLLHLHLGWGRAWQIAKETTRRIRSWNITLMMLIRFKFSWNKQNVLNAKIVK